MASNIGQQELGSGSSLSERQLLFAALQRLGLSVEEFSSQVLAERYPTPATLQVPGKNLSSNLQSISSTATHSLSGNDASAYHTEDEDSSSDWFDYETTEKEVDVDATVHSQFDSNSTSWSLNRATDNSNDVDAHDTDGRIESWIPVVQDLSTPTLVSRDGYSGTRNLDSSCVRSTASQLSQTCPQINLEPSPIDNDAYQHHTCNTLPSSQPVTELSLVGVGDVHPQHTALQQPPSRLHTPINGPDPVILNQQTYVPFGAFSRGSPADDDALRACTDVFCMVEVEDSASSSDGPRKKPRLGSRSETTPWSAGPVTPTSTTDLQAVSGPSPLTLNTSRSTKACLRCRFQHLKCEPDPSNPHGPCLKCKKLKRPTLLKQQCWPTILGEAHLYREQHAPNAFHTLRWSSMSMKNIQSWASEEIKIIKVGHVAMNKFYELKVRRYIIAPGDMINETWVGRDGATVVHEIPPYAIADMDEAAEMFEDYIPESADAYIEAFVSKENPLFYKTYKMACRYRDTAPTAEEKKLLRDVLQLWVCCRKTSNPECMYGDERLGVQTAYDDDSPWNNTPPIPPMMIAQMQCILYTKFLRPLKKEVLDGLWNVLNKNRRKSWFTVYLTMFVLLHSCSMITRRNQEFARACGLQCRFVNPLAIVDNQEGCNILLGHFHYINREVLPFHQTTDSQTFRNFVQAASLDQEQTRFIAGTAQWVRENESLMKQTRMNLEFEHDLYWVSQLYDTDWRKGPTVYPG